MPDAIAMCPRGLLRRRIVQLLGRPVPRRPRAFHPSTPARSRWQSPRASMRPAAIGAAQAPGEAAARRLRSYSVTANARLRPVPIEQDSGDKLPSHQATREFFLVDVGEFPYRDEET